MESLNEKFMNEVSKIKDPVVFLGLAKVLGIKLYEDGAQGKELKDRNPKDFSEIFAEVMAQFNGLGRRKKREVMKILRDANKVKGDINADNSKDTEETVSNEKM